MITEHASSPRGQTLPHLRRSGNAQPVTTENARQFGPGSASFVTADKMLSADEAIISARDGK